MLLHLLAVETPPFTTVARLTSILLYAALLMLVTVMIMMCFLYAAFVADILHLLPQRITICLPAGILTTAVVSNVLAILCWCITQCPPTWGMIVALGWLSCIIAIVPSLWSIVRSI